MQTHMKPTNMPWAVYRCNRLTRGAIPEDLQMMSGHLSPMEAMQEAIRLKQNDRHHSYLVGSA